MCAAAVRGDKSLRASPSPSPQNEQKGSHSEAAPVPTAHFGPHPEKCCNNLRSRCVIMSAHGEGWRKAGNTVTAQRTDESWAALYHPRRTYLNSSAKRRLHYQIYVCSVQTFCKQKPCRSLTFQIASSRYLKQGAERHNWSLISCFRHVTASNTLWHAGA